MYRVCRRQVHYNVIHRLPHVHPRLHVELTLEFLQALSFTMRAATDLGLPVFCARWALGPAVWELLRHTGGGTSSVRRARGQIYLQCALMDGKMSSKQSTKPRVGCPRHPEGVGGFQ